MIKELIDTAEEAHAALFTLWDFMQNLDHPDEAIRRGIDHRAKQTLRDVEPLIRRLEQALQRRGPLSHQPLTEDQIWRIKGHVPYHHAITLTRTVEEAHGIYIRKPYTGQIKPSGNPEALAQYKANNPRPPVIPETPPEVIALAQEKGVK